MIDFLRNGEVVESFYRYPVSYEIDGVVYRIADLVAAGHDVEALGFFIRAYPRPELLEGQYIAGTVLQVIDGRPVSTPTVANKTAEQLAEELASRRAGMSISPRQCRLALAQSGLLDAVEAMIAQADQVTRVTWEYAVTIVRTDPLIAQFALALELTDQQVDELFTLAATL